MKNLKSRIAAMNFLEFAVWGAYLTSMGNYLGKAGMGAEIAWFYAIQGIVSIFMPTIMGIIADKFIQPQRLLGICHLLAGAGMVGLFMLGEGSATPDKTLFIAVYAFGDICSIFPSVKFTEFITIWQCTWSVSVCVAITTSLFGNDCLQSSFVSS